MHAGRQTSRQAGVVCVARGEGAYIVVLLDELVVDGEALLVVEDHGGEGLGVCVLGVGRRVSWDEAAGAAEAGDNVVGESGVSVMTVVVEGDDWQTRGGQRGIGGGSGDGGHGGDEVGGEAGWGRVGL